MKKEDIEDFLTRTTALVMVPVLGILIECQTEGIRVDRDEAAEKLGTQMKKVIMKSILDWEHIRPGGIGPEAVKDDLRQIERLIFDE